MLPFLIFQIPSNILLKKIGASKIIPTIAALWGFITALIFFAHNATEVIILRFLLGVVEAGFFPGIMFWFTLWFPSRERARVVSIFMLPVAAANIVGAPLAGLIVQYVNWIGISGWRWLFLIEGLPPAIIALFGYKIMKDGPEKVNWLNADEKAMIRADLDAEKKLTTVETQKVGVAKILTNGMLWKMSLIYMFVQIAQQTAALWMPTLMKGFTQGVGFSASAIGFILIIPAVIGSITMVMNGNHSDKTGERKWHAIIPMLIFSASLLLINIPFGGMPYKIVMLAFYGIGLTTWYGPYWTMPSAFLSPEILAVALAFINSCSAAGGYIGNQLSGLIDSKFGSTGVFVFLGCVVLGSVILILTLDFKKMKVDHIYDEEEACA